MVIGAVSKHHTSVTEWIVKKYRSQVVLDLVPPVQFLKICFLLACMKQRKPLSDLVSIKQSHVCAENTGLESMAH